MKAIKNLLILGSLACTGTATADTVQTATEVLDPNSVNLLVNAVLTILMFVLRFKPKKK